MMNDSAATALRWAAEFSQRENWPNLGLAPFDHGIPSFPHSMKNI